MQIGELSDRTGATARMLRYYEEHGLIEPQRKPSGYRFFRESDVLRVRYIRCMLASALPTQVVAQALRFLLDEEPDVPESPEDRAHLAKVLRGELDGLTERIAILERSRGQLERFVTDIERSIVGPLEPAPSVIDDFGPAVRQGGPVPASSMHRAEASSTRRAGASATHNAGASAAHSAGASAAHNAMAARPAQGNDREILIK